VVLKTISKIEIEQTEDNFPLKILMKSTKYHDKLTY